MPKKCTVRDGNRYLKIWRQKQNGRISVMMGGSGMMDFSLRIYLSPAKAKKVVDVLKALAGPKRKKTK